MSASQFYQPIPAADVTYHLDDKTIIKVHVTEGRQGMMQHRFTNEETAKQFVEWAKQKARQNNAFPELIQHARPIKEGDLYVVRLTKLQFKVFSGVGAATTSSDVTYYLDEKQKIDAQITIGNSGMLQHRCKTEAEANNLLAGIKKQVGVELPDIERARVQAEASGQFLFRLSMRQFELLLFKQNSSLKEDVKVTPSFEVFKGTSYKI